VAWSQESMTLPEHRHLAHIDRQDHDHEPILLYRRQPQDRRGHDGAPRSLDGSGAGAGHHITSGEPALEGGPSYPSTDHIIDTPHRLHIESTIAARLDVVHGLRRGPGCSAVGNRVAPGEQYGCGGSRHHKMDGRANYSSPTPVATAEGIRCDPDSVGAKTLPVDHLLPWERSIGTALQELKSTNANPASSPPEAKQCADQERRGCPADNRAA